MGTQGPKKTNWLVLGAFGGSGEALSWGKKTELSNGQLKTLSCPLDNLVRIPIRVALAALVSRALQAESGKRAACGSQE